MMMSKGCKGTSEGYQGIYPSKIEWDLTNGPLSKLRKRAMIDTQVFPGSVISGVRPLGISWNLGEPWIPIRTEPGSLGICMLTDEKKLRQTASAWKPMRGYANTLAVVEWTKVGGSKLWKKTVGWCWLVVLYKLYKYKGWNTTQFYRDYFIKHDIRIPFLNNQYFMESMAGFFFRGSDVVNFGVPFSLGVHVAGQPTPP